MDLLLGVALVLGVMILVHEWGHFIAARFFGVRVDVFSIGFGPRLFGWKRGATDYRISMLPLGGYVRMAGQDPTDIDSADRDWKHFRAGKEDKPEDQLTKATQEVAKFRGVDQNLSHGTGAPDELMSKPRWQRAVISFAGPAVNLVFPIFMLTVYFVAIGVPYPGLENKPVVVTALPANSSGAAAGLKAGDRVVSINGQPSSDWADAEKTVTKLERNSKLTLVVENDGT